MANNDNNSFAEAYISIEEKILKFWKERDIFNKSLEKRKDRKRFVFYEGPPTANGRPGIHHFMGRVFKDLFVRYKTMRGYYVPRKAGWDTQGIPVEIGVEKELGLKSKKDIEKFGIAEFNEKARQSVWKYKTEWEEWNNRIGYWLDLNQPYITYDSDYIESLWWVMKQFERKGLLYQGHKVLPWCSRCGTALSSHEVAQGYEDVTEDSVYVRFKLEPAQNIKRWQLPEDCYVLAWTTTPWTLPGNVALAVGPKIEYVAVKMKQGEENAGIVYFIAKNRVAAVLGEGVEIVAEMTGKDLVGLRYLPLFDVGPLKSPASYQIYPAGFVTTEDGTGVVHTAVMYGEDDYELGKAINLPMHHTVTETGLFTEDVKEFAGQNVKAAEKGIIQYLEAKGYKLKVEPYSHSYPFCWRCKTPLLYYARDSWFIAMSKLRKALWKNNEKINWYPAHLKEGRFGEFIKEAKDWAISRERYWGTPLPIWKCQKCSKEQVIGSFAELQERRFYKPNTYVLVRHGWSQNNDRDAQHGTRSNSLSGDNYALTAEGVSHVTKTAEKIKSEGGLDLIVCSPFKRTHETAMILHRQTNAKVEIDPRLGEVQIDKDGTQYEAHDGAGDNYDLDYRGLGGETMREAKARMVGVILDLEKKYKGKRIAIVSHGHPLWMLSAFFRHYNDEETKSRRADLYLKQGNHSQEELDNYPYNGKGEIDPHRPFVDEIVLRCPACDGSARRVSDVADVWFDSGAMPYAQWHYPFENEGEFEKSFPADFICEGIDQTRGWFYTLLAISTALGRGPSYKNVLSYSHVLDEKGKKMSKSLGNVVDPVEVVKRAGVDATRWYFYSANNPGDYKLFVMRDVEMQLRGFISTLTNCLRFLELYEKEEDRPKKPVARPRNQLDHWLLSRLYSVISSATKFLDDYDPTSAARTIERFVIDDLSNWWVRRSRERFQQPENKISLRQSAEMLRFAMLKISKLLAPFMPFLADHIYKKLSNNEESVHLEDWPKVNAKLIQPQLEEKMVQIREAAAQGLALRKNAGIKVRQPLASLTTKMPIPPELAVYLRDEVNVKEIFINPTQEPSVTLDTKLTPKLISEGNIRELMRAIQDLRKDAGYKLNEEVVGYWQTDNKLFAAAIAAGTQMICKQTLLSSFEKQRPEKMSLDAETETQIGQGTAIWLGLKK